MPFVKVYIHFVWSTKNHIPMIVNKDNRQRIWQHILENARNKGIFIDFINGYSVPHCLVH